MAKYIYCIVPCNDELSHLVVPRIQHGPTLSAVTLTSVGLSAVVSDIPPSMQNGDTRRNREKLLLHHEVISGVMKNHDVIPLHFGTVAKDEEEVAQVLCQGEKKLKELFQVIRGRVEYALSASWKDKGTIQEIAFKDPTISEKRMAIAARGTPPTIVEAMEIGKLVHGAMTRESTAVVTKVSEMLQTLGATHVPLPPENEMSVLSEAILIKRAYEENLRDVVVILKRIFGPTVLWTNNGPLPPYHFIDGRFQMISRSALQSACEKLELSERFSLEQLKEAYREKAKACHPDKNRGDASAQERFEQIEEAYRLLRKSMGAEAEKGTGVHDFLLLFDPSTAQEEECPI